jgi:ribosomal protein S18 acetylase RimI-like enzyme
VIDIREVAHSSPEYWATIELRRNILRLPLGLDFSTEELDAEAGDIHLAAFNPDLVGCLVLVPRLDGEIKMRQVAVRPDLQRTGLGTQLVVASEVLARSRGFRTMTLHARDTALAFYRRLGYDVEGCPFEEVSIPHYRMSKRLV